MAVQPDFHIKQNDTGPPLERVAAFTDNTVQDLTAATVNFWIQAVDEAGELTGTTILGGAAVIVDAVAGRWRYDWVAADTASSGMHGGELEIIIAGVRTTFPQQGYLYFEIVDDISNG